MQLIPTAHSVSTVRTARVSLFTLCRRAHALGIETHEVLACPTVAALQALAKHRYHQLARHFHPDMEAQRKADGMRCNLRGRTFDAVAKTYAWLLALDGEQVIDGTLGLTPLEVPLPGEWARAPLAVADGWQVVSLGW